MKWFRQAFAHYIKDEYRFNKLGNKNGTSNISVDESMLTHISGQKIWVVGAKNNTTGKIRIDIFKIRNTENLKTFIFNHIKKNNNIITDGWPDTTFWMMLITTMKFIYMDLKEILIWRTFDFSY